MNKIQKIWANKHPCVYLKAIICADCPRRICDDGDTCDMSEGRTYYLEMFEEGYAEGKKHSS